MGFEILVPAEFRICQREPAVDERPAGVIQMWEEILRFDQRRIDDDSPHQKHSTFDLIEQIEQDFTGNMLAFGGDHQDSAAFRSYQAGKPWPIQVRLPAELGL
jgi:hypothetical protein